MKPRPRDEQILGLSTAMALFIIIFFLIGSSLNSKNEVLIGLCVSMLIGFYLLWRIRSLLSRTT